MLQFMRLGGVMMWPILFLGLAAIAVTVRDRQQSPLARQLDVAMLSLSIGWSLLGALVTLTHAEGAPADVLVTGLGESCAPAALGFLLYGAGRLAATVRRVAV